MFLHLLIALLVVVAIIGILAPMLLQVPGRARGQARISSDQSRQRQCYPALQLDADGHDQFETDTP